MRPLVTLLTDFGTADGYVAEMKGVILSAVPDAGIVDVSHDVPAQDVESGRLALARYWRRFPIGTVHVAVVDPGVGSSRAALAVESEGRLLLGPDNGVLSPALLAATARVVALPVPPHASPTFHGRDVFAPAAARLLSGVALDALGTPCDTPVVRRTPEARRNADSSIAGEVIAVDRFGNAITNLIARGAAELVVGGRAVRLCRSYSEVASGSCLAVVGSNGLVEIARRDGSAAEHLGLRRGSPVVLRAVRP